MIQVSPSSGAVYTVTVTGITGNGTLGLNLVDTGSIHDLSGNPLSQQNALGFQPQQTFAVGGVDAPIAVAVGDVNGDGKPDILAANDGTGQVSFLLGNGNGTFQALRIIPAGSTIDAMAVGDLTGDGKLDLVVANQYSASVTVVLGNGNGTFQAQHTFATGAYPDSVSVADVNGDGIPDLIVANSKSNSVSVLLGNGNGTFQSQTTFGAGADAQRCPGGPHRRRQIRHRCSQWTE